jgi:hypothetical protein
MERNSNLNRSDLHQNRNFLTFWIANEQILKSMSIKKHIPILLV